MNYKNFIEWALKQPASVLDYDKTYGLQCVDLIKWYIKKVRGIEPESIGNAVDYYNKRNSKYIKNVTANGGGVYVLRSHDKMEKFTFYKGDIIVFGGGKYGHIAILDSYDKTGVNVYDTNFRGTHETTKQHRYLFNTRPILCVIRLSNVYTQIEKKYFTPTHRVKEKQIVFSDNELTENSGTVFTDELVKTHFEGPVLAFIQYETATGYKVGLIKKSYLEKI